MKMLLSLLVEQSVCGKLSAQIVDVNDTLCLSVSLSISCVFMPTKKIQN